MYLRDSRQLLGE
jgi:hypothetical protein